MVDSKTAVTVIIAKINEIRTSGEGSEVIDVKVTC